MTVIRGTRAEFRLQLKENKKGYGMEVRRMQEDLEQVLGEERMLAERDIMEKQSILDMVCCLFVCLLVCCIVSPFCK